MRRLVYYSTLLLRAVRLNRSLTQADGIGTAVKEGSTQLIDVKVGFPGAPAAQRVLLLADLNLSNPSSKRLMIQWKPLGPQ